MDEITREMCIARLNDIVDHSNSYAYCEFSVVVNDWAKGNKSRTYFAIVEKSTNSKVSKHYCKRTYGYFDNVSGEYIPDKYGDVRENYNFSGYRY